MINRVLIKLGGASLNNPDTLEQASALISGLRQRGHQVILVHGGGPAINEELTRQNITWQFINGQRQTTPEMMTVIDQVLGSQVNGQIVGFLRTKNIPAQGVSGAQDETLLCKQLSKELIQVGEIIDINVEVIENLLNQNLVPVIAPIGVDLNGLKYNINADWAATKLASALQVKELIFLTDQNGVLDQNKELISVLTPDLANQLIQDQVIQGGMMTKIRTMIYGLSHGIQVVRVINATKASALLTNAKLGTALVQNSIQSQPEKSDQLWNQKLT